MNEEASEYMNHLQRLDGHAIIALLLLGFVLIVVNSATHWLQEWISAKNAERTKIAIALETNVDPLKRCSDLIASRVASLLCGPLDKQDINKAALMMADEAEYERRLIRLGLLERTWSESTAVSFLQYVWSTDHFKSGVSRIGATEDIADIDYLVSSKIPMPLRGHLYNKRFIIKELYEECVSFFASEKTIGYEPTVREVYHVLSADEYHRKIFKKLAWFFNENFVIDYDFFEKENPLLPKYVALAHFCVYVIDLCQDVNQRLSGRSTGYILSV